MKKNVLFRLFLIPTFLLSYSKDFFKRFLLLILQFKNLKIVLLSIINFTILFSCQNEFMTTEENQNHPHQHSENPTIISQHLKGKEAIAVADILTNELNKSVKFKILSRTISHIVIKEGEIDYSDILKVTDTQTGVENYTFRILNHPDDNYSTFHNLVYTFDGENSFINILTYNLDDDFAKRYNETGSILGFSGRIIRSSISNDICPEEPSNPSLPPYPFPGNENPNPGGGGYPSQPGSPSNPGVPGGGGGSGGGGTCTIVEISITCTDCFRSFGSFESWSGSVCGNGNYGAEMTVSFITSSFCKTTSCNPPGEIGVLLPLPIKNDPCIKTKALLQKTEVTTKVNMLKEQSKIKDNQPNYGEKAFKLNADGSASSPIIQGAEHSADLGYVENYTSYYHNHTPKGIKIHSPPDIYMLFKFITAQPLGTPVSASFGGMVGSNECASGCPDGYEYSNFIIRFGGTYDEAIAIKNRNYTETELKAFMNQFDKYEQNIRPKSGYSSQNGNFLNFKGLEEVFFYALDKMNIDKNKINLQRIDKNGTVYNVTLDANGKPVETPCP